MQIDPQMLLSIVSMIVAGLVGLIVAGYNRRISAIEKAQRDHADADQRVHEELRNRLHAAELELARLANLSKIERTVEQMQAQLSRIAQQLAKLEAALPSRYSYRSPSGAMPAVRSERPKR